MDYPIPIKIKPRAKEDLLEIWYFIAHVRFQLKAADTLMEWFSSEFQRLANNPNLGTLCERINPEFRQQILDPYIIFYKVEDGSLVIYRVLHSARNLSDIL